MRWLDALHVLDSAFPSGAHAHSFALESLRPPDLQAALRLRVEETLARLELVFVRHAYSDDWLDLDALLHASLLPRESREASAAIGASFLRGVCDFVEHPRLGVFLQAGRHHHQAVVTGAVCAAFEVPADLASEWYAFNSLRAQVAAAQRLGWIGQRAAQRVLHALKPSVAAAVTLAGTLSLEQTGAFTPGWDIASMHHERAAVRMFAS
jgi:urease accessory protein